MLEHLYATHRHLLDRKFCERCGKNFKRSDTLKRHMEVHLDVREKCPMENCGMMVRRLSRFVKFNFQHLKLIFYTVIISNGNHALRKPTPLFGNFKEITHLQVA